MVARCYGGERAKEHQVGVFIKSHKKCPCDDGTVQGLDCDTQNYTCDIILYN